MLRCSISSGIITHNMIPIPIGRAQHSASYSYMHWPSAVQIAPRREHTVARRLRSCGSLCSAGAMGSGVVPPPTAENGGSNSSAALNGMAADAVACPFLYERLPHESAIADSYEKLGVPIGEGTYGTVWRAQCRRTGQQVAMKKVVLKNEREGHPLGSVPGVAAIWPSLSWWCCHGPTFGRADNRPLGCTHGRANDASGRMHTCSPASGQATGDRAKRSLRAVSPGDGAIRCHARCGFAAALPSSSWPSPHTVLRGLNYFAALRSQFSLQAR